MGTGASEKDKIVETESREKFEMSDGLRDLLEPGEEMRWRGSAAEKHTRKVLWAGLGILGLFTYIPFWIVFMFLGDELLGRLPFIEALLAAFIPTVMVLYPVYRMHGRWKGNREYAVTDQRALMSKGILRKKSESIPWEDVASVEFPKGDYRTILIRPKKSNSTLAKLKPNFLSDLRFIMLEDGHKAYEPIIQAFSEARAPSEDAKKLSEEKIGEDTPWSSSRSSVSENIESNLEPSEKVVWRATQGRRTELKMIAIGIIVLWPFVFIASMAVMGFVVPIFVDPMKFSNAIILSAIFATLASAALYWAQEKWNENREYVVTDERLIASKGMTSDWEDVKWENVEALERRGSDIWIYDRKPENIEPVRGRYTVVKPPTIIFGNVPEPKRAYWRIRELHPNRVSLE